MTDKRWASWLCVVALLVLPALPAGAVLWCDSYCNCERPCSVKCWDGYPTTCGEASYPCAGACFAPTPDEAAAGLVLADDQAPMSPASGRPDALEPGTQPLEASPTPLP